MRIIGSLAFAAALIGGATIALADVPGPGWMPVEGVLQQLRMSGYTRIIELEANDGHWEGEGIKGGREMEFHADPRTGLIMSEHPE